jgi:hypothetical protein
MAATETLGVIILVALPAHHCAETNRGDTMNFFFVYFPLELALTQRPTILYIGQEFGSSPVDRVAA